MNTKDFTRLGIPLGEATRRATDFVAQFILSGGDKTRLEEELKAIVANPALFAEEPMRKELAKAIVNAPPPPRAEPVKYRQWGEGLEYEAVMQMEKACLLPVAVAGALMPDQHVGYGLPIGGVLATENPVIPYAVGVDIACRMKMTVLDVPILELERHSERLTRAIEAETRFGVGTTFKNRRQHEVLDTDWALNWQAMELMGRYAAANHALIHQHVAANLGAEVLLDLENHHNFAWKEKHVINGVEKELIVHRKGATPAGQGVLGIIPGSMASHGFVVSGKGNPESLNSASHGAGRVMSRTQANKTFKWKKVNAFLREKGVTLISAGLDEVPMVYKNIHEVMAAQKDLVTILGQFDPKLVKMAPHGERAED